MSLVRLATPKNSLRSSKLQVLEALIPNSNRSVPQPPVPGLLSSDAPILRQVHQAFVFVCVIMECVKNTKPDDAPMTTRRRQFSRNFGSEWRTTTRGSLCCPDRVETSSLPLDGAAWATRLQRPHADMIPTKRFCRIPVRLVPPKTWRRNSTWRVS